MSDQSDSVSVYVPYRGRAGTRFKKSPTWSDQDREAGE